MKMMREHLLFAVAMLTLAFAASASAHGVLRHDKADDDWEVLVSPCLRGMGPDGTSTVGTLPPLDIDVSFSDLVDKLDFAISLHTEFHRGKWAFVIDPTYVSVTIDLIAGPMGVKPSASAGFFLCS